jgi:hypothetical protein
MSIREVCTYVSYAFPWAFLVLGVVVMVGFGSPRDLTSLGPLPLSHANMFCTFGCI